MIHFGLRLCITFFLFLTMMEAKEVSGITVASTFSHDGVELSLKGAGVRDKFFMDLYVASLYLGASHENAKTILHAKEPMALELIILSSLITSEKMEEATKEGFINASGDKLASLQERIDRFIALFKEPIAINDRYTFLYTPTEGTRIYKNKILKTTILGDDFKEALLGIWLGDKPAQKRLKKNLLGE